MSDDVQEADATLSPTQRRRWWMRAAMAAGGLVLAVIYFRFDPRTAHFFPPCLVYRFTGLRCPGCGSQRAIHCLLHADFRGALSFNPLLVVCLPVIIYEIVRPPLVKATGWRLPSFFARAAVIWALAVVVIIYGVVRNCGLFLGH